ncbi:MAG: nodulation protein NfeD [Candidatus Cloacimonadota bacterium]|nr:nodulation protein NfeD [Candidatus Cloacimonadota bacterium]
MNTKTKFRSSSSTRLFCVLILFFLLTSFVYADTSKIYLFKIDGVIGPPMADYLIRNIEIAEENNAAAILLEINTPGGLSVSMRSIVSEIMRTPIPVIGYVTPEGAHAASAGAIIMLACDIAAMTPTSSIGAAHPVNMGGKIDSTMEKKVINDMVSYVRSLAEKKDRNADIAAEMVIESISLTAKEAKKENIIEYVAKSRDDLFEQINGLEISKGDEIFILQTKDAIIVKREMNFIERFLFHISNPNIAYILLMLGIYGIIAEFSNPGIGFAGVFGTISLLIAFFALSNLPINIVGILLIIAGIILIILEIKVQSSGILGIGGVVATILGSMMLINSNAPFLQISISLIIGVGIFSLLFFILLFTLVLKVYKKHVTTGREGEIGEIGYALTELNPQGNVFVRGEIWSAESLDGNIEKNAKIKVIKFVRMKLFVEKE